MTNKELKNKNKNKTTYIQKKMKCMCKSPVNTVRIHVQSLLGLHSPSWYAIANIMASASSYSQGLNPLLRPTDSIHSQPVTRPTAPTAGRDRSLQLCLSLSPLPYQDLWWICIPTHERRVLAFMVGSMGQEEDLRLSSTSLDVVPLSPRVTIVLHEWIMGIENSVYVWHQQGLLVSVICSRSNSITSV